MKGPWFVDWVHKIEAHTTGPFKTLDDVLRHIANVAYLYIRGEEDVDPFVQIILRNEE